MRQEKPGVLGVVQFIHPGAEHKVDALGQTRWNLGEHRRKYMSAPGIAINKNDEKVESGLYFWGEWEGLSLSIYSWADGKKGLPRNLVVPEFLMPKRVPGLQNTDPYVFGSEFKYTICKQVRKNGRETFLTRLLPGSLILFGSNLGGSFVLDTVFVVDDRIRRHSRETWQSVLSDASDTYTAASLLPLYWDEKVENSSRFTHYEGATFDNPKNGMYSFVPALLETVEPTRFARPRIDVEGIISHTLNMNIKFSELGHREIQQVWTTVRDQVRDQELALGVSFAEPTFESTLNRTRPN
jgi:hypothetical protein